MTGLMQRMIQARTIAIVGAGLLGGSIGLGLRAAGYRGRITGVGRRVQTLQRAKELGCIDDLASSLEAAVAQSDLVILATPLGTFANLLSRMAAHVHPNLVITDVGSTKAQVCADARRLLGRAGRFVGSHPMAGSEQHGPEAARADLFTGKPCILTPEDQTDAAAVSVVESLWRTLGMRLCRMSPQEHDQKAAAISHLPHAVAALLVELASHEQAMGIASSGFRDTTRVASGDPEVWADVFVANRQAVAGAIDALALRLTAFRELVEHGRREDLARMLRDSKMARDAWLSGASD